MRRVNGGNAIGRMQELVFNYGHIEGNNWAFNITEAEAAAR